MTPDETNKAKQHMENTKAIQKMANDGKKTTQQTIVGMVDTAIEVGDKANKVLKIADSALSTCNKIKLSAYKMTMDPEDLMNAEKKKNELTQKVKRQYEKSIKEGAKKKQ